MAALAITLILSKLENCYKYKHLTGTNSTAYLTLTKSKIKIS